MKSIGIVRKLDSLGRIVLPKELRRTLEIHERDPIEIFVNGKIIMLQKYTHSCVFCGSEDNTQQFKDINLCAQCRGELSGN